MICQNVVRIGEPFFPFVCIDQLAQFEIINGAIIVWQIACSIVAPQHTIRDNSADLSDKLIPTYASLRTVQAVPLQTLTPQISVASCTVERAGSWAGWALCPRGGQRSGLSVAGDAGDGDVHRSGVVN